jgi:transcriptional regulator with XRE-family HTH domain
MTPFRAWRKRLGLTQAQAAEALGRGKRSVEVLDRAETLPKETDLACRWLEADHLGLTERYCACAEAAPSQADPFA